MPELEPELGMDLALAQVKELAPERGSEPGSVPVKALESEKDPELGLDLALAQVKALAPERGSEPVSVLG